MVIPAGNHWRVGMRYSCPSVSANLGRPVADASKELGQLSRLLEQHAGRSADIGAASVLQAGRAGFVAENVCRSVQVLVRLCKTGVI